MVYLYTDVVVPVSITTILLILAWYIVFASNRATAMFKNFKGYAIFFSLTTLIIFGTWFWVYFNRPSNVGIFWHYLTLTLILGGLGIFVMYRLEVILNPFLIIIFFITIFNWGKIFIFLFSGLLMAILVYTVDKRFRAFNPKIAPPLAILLVILLIISLIGINLFIFTPVKNANYFDSTIEQDHSQLPYHTKVSGDAIRVVDYDLAESIMRKSNIFGSNTRVSQINLGAIDGKTYWIGAVSFDGNKFLRRDLNHYQGFIAVDFRNPDIEPIIIRQEFFIGKDLVLDRQLERLVYNYDINYIVADNTYFTISSEGDIRLIVPYSIQSVVLRDRNVDALITQGVEQKGGILEIDKDGNILYDYKDLTELPEYAHVQYYSERWLEREIRMWGESITQISPEPEFGALTHFGGIFKSQWRMGIDDNVRVIIDPDTGKNIQYVMLESTGSDNQVLRGAIKANTTGIYFYDWSEYGFIDTNTAKDFANTQITNALGTITHGYDPLLPILYPIKDNPQSIQDYAYIIPLQFQQIRFGGIVIIDPIDKTGNHASIRLVGSTETYNISNIIEIAIADYLIADLEGIDGDFHVDSIYQYVELGNTIIAMNGNFTFSFNNETEAILIVFRQDRLANIQDWLFVLQVNQGDEFKLVILFDSGVYYGVEILEN
jgi:hypothetical protein